MFRDGFQNNRLIIARKKDDDDDDKLTMPAIIAIFGGTGQTGRHAVDYALEKGYKVQMLARTPSKVARKNDNLTVVEGGITDKEAVKKTIQGATYVLSFVGGPAKAAEYPPNKMLNFVKRLWSLMDAEDSVKVFVYQSSSLAATPGKSLDWFTKILRHVVGWSTGISHMFADNEQATTWMNDDKKDSFAFIGTRPGALVEKEDSDVVVECRNDKSMPMSPIPFKALAACVVRQ